MSLRMQPAREGTSDKQVRIVRTFKRFTVGQRWEHVALMVTSAVLLLTGLPQKYRAATWSQQILATPERVELIQTIHHIAAVLLTLEVIYHLVNAIVLMSRRKLPASIFPSGKDLADFGTMVKYLFFLSNRKPRYGKYNFEQKFTYWFLVFAITIMVFSGFILWFPEFFTKFIPGGIIPAAKFAHSSEAIAGAVFIIIWHFYHVHLERLNLSIFTGDINEDNLKEYHALEYQRLTAGTDETENPGEEE
jgi:formate dehydrogenase subunit gamma